MSRCLQAMTHIYKIGCKVGARMIYSEVRLIYVFSKIFIRS